MLTYFLSFLCFYGFSYSVHKYTLCMYTLQDFDYFFVMFCFEKSWSWYSCTHFQISCWLNCRMINWVDNTFFSWPYNYNLLYLLLYYNHKSLCFYLYNPIHIIYVIISYIFFLIPFIYTLHYENTTYYILFLYMLL